MPNKHCICVFLLSVLSITTLLAQEEDYESDPGLMEEFENVPQTGYDLGRPDIKFTLATGSSFNGKDFLIGFDGGITDEQNAWSAKLKFDFRPFYRKVRIRETENLFYQYREKRYFLALELEKYFFPLVLNTTGMGIYLQGDGGYYFGSYRGTDYSPADYFLLAPGGGLAVNFSNDVIIQAGGTWFKTRSENIPDHQIRIKFHFTF